MGLDPEQITQEQKKAFCMFLKDYFKEMHVGDLNKAYDLASAGRLQMDLSKYYKINNTLLGSLMDSYKPFKAQQTKYDVTPQQSEKVSEKAKEDIMRGAIEEAYFDRMNQESLDHPDQYYAKLFNWLKNRAEQDISWNITEIEQRNRLEIKRTIKDPREHNAFQAWVKGANDNYDVRLKMMTYSDLFIQYLDRCIKKDVNWNYYLS